MCLFSLTFRVEFIHIVFCVSFECVSHCSPKCHGKNEIKKRNCEESKVNIGYLVIRSVQFVIEMILFCLFNRKYVRHNIRGRAVRFSSVKEVQDVRCAINVGLPKLLAEGRL